jgi:hypothetical protein
MVPAVCAVIHEEYGIIADLSLAERAIALRALRIG